MIDPVVPRRLATPVLEPIQRALTGQRMASIALPRSLRAQHVALARHQGEQRIVAQRLVIVQVLVAKRDPEHPLRHQLQNRVLRAPRRPPIAEAGAEPAQPARPLRHLPQQHQPPAVRRGQPCIEATHHPPPPQVLELELIGSTVRLHRAHLPAKRLSSDNSHLAGIGSAVCCLW